MVYDSSAEADIRGINIDKLAKGFGVVSSIMKQHVQVSKTKNREIRWFRKGVSLANAALPLDTADSTDITISHIQNTSFKSRPFVIEQKWERKTSYVRKFFVESPLFSMEDIKDNDVDILATNVRDIVNAVGWQVDRRIYDVLTEATTSGTPNPTIVNTTAATAGWATTGTCNPILDLLNAIYEIGIAGYEAKGATCLMNPLEYKSLINYLISVKGSSIPSFASDKVKSGVLMELLGLKIVVSKNATADWVVTWVPQRACTYKSFMPITSVVMTEPGIGKKIRVWEEGEALLTDPLAVHVISSAS